MHTCKHTESFHSGGICLEIGEVMAAKDVWLQLHRALVAMDMWSHCEQQTFFSKLEEKGSSYENNLGDQFSSSYLYTLLGKNED